MFITEDFVSFIWMHLNFNFQNLKTADHKDIQILDPGMLNIHSGPDFLEAQIRIEGILWAGAVEIHVKASDWHAHGHKDNADFEKVILHVVWESDTLIKRSDGSGIPTLALKGRTKNSTLTAFQELIYTSNMELPCGDQLRSVEKIIITNMIHKALIGRLERKAKEVEQLFQECGSDWEEVCYRILLKNFGFKVNQDNMLLLSKFLPFRIVRKHYMDLFQLEALLFGTAGFLENGKHRYQRKLKTEYEYLKHKYNLGQPFLQRYHWKFLRMRPQNFPTIRLAQLAVFLHKYQDIFGVITRLGSYEDDMGSIHIMQSDYWIKHYDFGKEAKRILSGMGATSVRNIMINTFVPVLAAFSRYTGDLQFVDRAVKLLESLKPENNRITRIYNQFAIEASNAADSQGLIELYRTYCYKKQCLNCNIGTQLLLISN